MKTIKTILTFNIIQCFYSPRLTIVLTNHHHLTLTFLSFYLFIMPNFLLKMINKRSDLCVLHFSNNMATVLVLLIVHTFTSHRAKDCHNSENGLKATNRRATHRPLQRQHVQVQPKTRKETTLPGDPEMKSHRLFHSRKV